MNHELVRKGFGGLAREESRHEDIIYLQLLFQRVTTHERKGFERGGWIIAILCH